MPPSPATAGYVTAGVTSGIGSTQRITWNHNLGAHITMQVLLTRDGGATFDLEGPERSGAQFPDDERVMFQDQSIDAGHQRAPDIAVGHEQAIERIVGPTQSLSKNCSGSESLCWWGRRTRGSGTTSTHSHAGRDTRPPSPRRLMGAGAPAAGLIL